jgi:hypothetical protein
VLNTFVATSVDQGATWVATKISSVGHQPEYVPCLSATACGSESERWKVNPERQRKGPLPQSRAARH